MSNLTIHSARRNDIESIYALFRIEHWNFSQGMIKRLFSYEPNGCFVAQINEKHVGHVFSVSYGKVGWIGGLIVNPERRRKSLGTILMRQAMSYLRDLGVETIKLEAVPEIANLYRKLGFVEEFDSLRFMRINKEENQSSALSPEPLGKDEIAEIVAFDSKYFGADRTRVLRRLLEDSPELCFASRVNSKIVG